MAQLGVSLAGLDLRNPILSASGTFGHGLEMRHFVDPSAVGGLVSKTVTIRPRPGNPMPRVHETEAGLLNSIGLENRGVEAYLEHTLPEVADADTLIVTNIGAESEGQFAELAAMLDERPEIDAFEVNLSCPNVDGGSLPYCTDARTVERVLGSVRAATSKPVFAKLSPNVTRIDEIAVACERGGADALTAINTVLGMQVDWRTGRPGLNTVVGGYSGTGIKPIALRCAFECLKAVRIPVIGCGGIATVDDVLEFLSVGCTAVQVGTASFGEPGLLDRLARALEERLEEAGFSSVAEVIGNLDLSELRRREATGRTP